MVLKKAMDELNKPHDEFQIFGDYIAAELRSMRSEANRRRLKRKIQQALLEISELDDNEGCDSRQSLQSQTSSTQSTYSDEASHYQQFTDLQVFNKKQPSTSAYLLSQQTGNLLKVKL